MKPDAFTIPTGQSPRKVRDFLLWGNSQECFSGRSVASHFGADITEDLIATGLIEPFPHRRERENDLFQVSDLGSRLANIRLLPRIDRAKAEGIVDAFLERVRQVNARAELLYRVVKVNAFGSFITDAPDLGDIDLAIAMQGKQDEIRKAGGEWIATLIARAEAAGKRMRSRSEMLFYGELEVRRLLKGRNRYLSFHSFDEIENLAIESRRIFPGPGISLFPRFCNCHPFTQASIAAGGADQHRD